MDVLWPRYCSSCGWPLIVPPGSSEPALQCPHCGRFHYRNPIPVVILAAFSPAGKILLTRKASYPPGRWALIAGYIESNETAEGAAIREAWEEAHVQIAVDRILGTHTYPPRPGRLFIALRAQITDGTPSPGSDVDQVALFDPHHAPLPPDSLAARVLRDALERT